MIWIATTHVATCVYDHFTTADGTLEFESGSNSVCGGHDLDSIRFAPSTTHTVALTMHATLPFNTAIGSWMLVAFKEVHEDF
jgi:hypothetical protein